MKNLASMFFMLLIGSQSFAWTLVQESTDHPTNKCLKEATVAPDGNDALYVKAVELGSLSIRTDEVNQGRQCRPQNSSHILGGMICTETRFSQDTYTVAECRTEFFNFKCNPFKDGHVATLKITSEKMEYSEAIEYYDGNTYTTKCQFAK